MVPMQRLGIHGLGAFLPDVVRKNDAWPREVVEQWVGRHAWDPQREERALAEVDDEGARLALRAIAELGNDPFQGAGERRVMPEGMTSADMEVEACRRAMVDAEVDAGEIDVILGFSFVPDFLHVPNACIVHERLGLPRRCFTMNADAVCNSFQMQLTLAEGLIRSGAATRALLFQSSAVWRVNPAHEPMSVHFGDGATAVVVGPVADGRGLLAQAHRTDGSVHRALVCTVPGKDWWEDGRIQSTTLDRADSRRMFLRVPSMGREVVHDALAQAGHAVGDVDFFACHQATSWFRRIAQEHIGIQHARTLDTYPWAGTLSAANLPLVLHEARRVGSLRDGDLVAMYQGGTGMTYSGTVLRWGR